jgi:5-methylcytosine-specific restriction endonuclease McrA
MQGCIVLNGDYTYLNTVSWQKAIKLMCKGKATVLKHSTTVIKNFEKTIEIIVPAVLKLIKIIRTIYRTRVPFSKRNVLTRDGFKCVYCGKTGKRLTIDHVVPVSKGGKSTFENCVAACPDCNHKKGNKLPSEAHMFMKKRPTAPTISEFVRMKAEKAGIFDLLKELGVY